MAVVLYVNGIVEGRDTVDHSHLSHVTVDLSCVQHNISRDKLFLCKAPSLILTYEAISTATSSSPPGLPRKSNTRPFRPLPPVGCRAQYL